MELMKVNVKASSENRTKITAQIRGFEVIVDEPEQLGGTDAGPNPVEYVLAALAGCLNVVGHVVAREMKFKLNGLTIDLEGELDPAKFMGQNTSARAGYKEIRVTMHPDTDADQDSLNKWAAAIEERCPVSDNLINATPVKIAVMK